MAGAKHSFERPQPGRYAAWGANRPPRGPSIQVEAINCCQRCCRGCIGRSIVVARRQRRWWVASMIGVDTSSRRPTEIGHPRQTKAST
ncbi:hypothetical protein GGTG_11919 [Gaeumannomyces tritici R3-111a-1]|uniref:Uncharacterized protein n=1 Tax=Gaeumannomyces tritici (strain R3-111a-1) TaxID=644352 RepID=J3PEI8_GAET3|nr:hypothetical protein GGTG_11919 [Gaeumannomyces tritici R3-111a-1]EJT70896.1 hypothetical protein GGTG_11919 [Gaeumannomyces tritici R3-111a-1]